MALIADLERKLEDQEHLTEQQRLMLQRQLDDAKARKATRKATKVLICFVNILSCIKCAFIQIHLSFVVLYACICPLLRRHGNELQVDRERACAGGGDGMYAHAWEVDRGRCKEGGREPGRD